jgi:hypothetical protein
VRGLLPTLVLSAALLSGCGSALKKTLAVPADVRASALAIYPFGFRWPEPAYRSFELSQRLIDVVLADKASDRALLLGPSELRVFRSEDDNVFAASTLGALVPKLGLRPSSVLVLRPWAEKRVHSSQKSLFDAKGKPMGASATEEVLWIGHVEVIHAATRARWVEVSGEARADPFAERTDEGADPAPELTALMEKLTREAVGAIRDRLGPLEGGATSREFHFALSPRAALAFSDSGRPSGEVEMARLDPLDAELFRRARARFANPRLDEARIDALLPLPAGIEILEAPKGAPLAVGDLVVQVNGEEALPHTFARARLMPGEDVLRVRRQKGGYEDVRLP